MTIIESYTTSGIPFIYPTTCSTSNTAKIINADITPTIKTKFFVRVRTRFDAVWAYLVANTGDCESSSLLLEVVLIIAHYLTTGFQIYIVYKN